MNGLTAWLLMTLAWAVLLLLFGLWRLPIFVTRRSIQGFGRRTGGDPWNRLNCPGLVNAKEDPVVMTSPDMLVSFGAFDTSRQPVRIRCKVPDSDTYWSISLYAWNTDNFFVLNDRSAKLKEFDLIVVGPKGSHQKKDNEEVVVAPTERGVIVVRAVVKNREDAAEIEKMEQIVRQTAILPYA